MAAAWEGGRLVVYGFMGRDADTPDAVAQLKERMANWNANRNGIRCQLYSLGEIARRTPKLVHDDLAELVELLGARRIAPVVGAELPLEEVRTAHALLEEGSVTGNIVLITTPG